MNNSPDKKSGKLIVNEDETEEIRNFVKQKELQNEVLKKIIEKMNQDKIKKK